MVVIQQPQLPPLWPLMKRREWAAVGYLAAWKTVRFLPEPIGRKLFAAGAHYIVTRKADSAPIRQLRKNLARVVGGAGHAAEPHSEALDTLVEQAVQSYARYWYEVFAFDKLLATHGDHLVVDGIDNVDQSRGAVVTITHSGNWDMAGAAYVHAAGSFVTVTERLKPHELFDAFVAYRRSLGFTVLAHSKKDSADNATRSGAREKGTGESGNEKTPFEQLVDHINAGMAAIFPGERDLKGTGVVVDFFGEKATFPAGPAAAAIRCGVPLHIGEVFFQGDRWCARISPPILVTDVEETTQRVAHEFEKTLRAHPADWHMLQPVWIADRTPRGGTPAQGGE